MLSNSSQRPDSPLIVKCLFDKSMRRITFASAATCRLDALRARIEDCFSLSASTFFIAYTDDDGEETSIRSEADLTEAIHYFDTGACDDDYSVAVPPSSFSTYASDAPLPLHARDKVTLRVQVVVEYDGPSLSEGDTASLAGTFDESLYLDGAGGGDARSAAESSDMWRSEASAESASSAASRAGWSGGHIGNDNVYGAGYGGPLDDPLVRDPSRTSAYNDNSPARRRISSHSLPSDHSRGMSLGTRRDDRESRNGAFPADSIASSRHQPPSRGPPSILTSSELGARWLREQNERAKRRSGSGSGSGSRGPGSSSSHSRSSGKRGASLSGEDNGSDDEASMYEEGRGDLALVKDRRGKWYYSYQTSDLAFEADSVDGRDDRMVRREDEWLPQGRSTNSAGKGRVEWLPTLRSAPSPSITGDSDHTSVPDDGATEHDGAADEPAAPPFFAPDCSACGLRLDYMRYACAVCGEGHMWQEGQQEKRIVLEAHLGGVGSSDGASSGNAEWGPAAGAAAGEGRSQGSSASSASSSSATAEPETRLTEGDLRSSESDASTDRTSTSESSPPTTPVDALEDGRFIAPPLSTAKTPHKAPHGYELCAGCIEIQGIAHARAMGAVDLELLSEGAFARETDAGVTPVAGFARKLGAMRHTFRELIWSAKGWKEIEYNDECRCSICNLETYQNRFKCISCANFNLCRSCHQNAQEIHPAHCFLSVPDQAKRLANGIDRVGKQGNGQVPKLLKHPGAFCHNCMQDIVGPRFHCAVCPSWDLCIQCEGLATTSATGPGAMHTPDHIMMKIPLPLASSEVEFVSRRARDRWTQRDYSAVSSGSGTASPPALTMRSPTNETVYGGAASQPAQQRSNINVMVRDSLDHGVQCRGCNEWIMGRRYQCANCPSDPVPYSLCSLCELRSYKIHDPMHVFVKFDRPVHFPLQSPGRMLPILYKTPVGQVRSTAPLDPRDPTAYLRCVTHSSTICDIHVGPIHGIWLRCAQCAVSFDICQECESIADHDPTHVFVVFKSEVDMPVFRAVANLSATHSRPLIHQHVYL